MLRALHSRLRAGLSAPARLRLDVALKSASGLRSMWRQPVQLVTGTPGAAGVPASVAFAGTLPQQRSWFAAFFGDTAQVQTLGNVTLFDVILGRGALTAVDAIVCPTNPLLERFMPADRWFIVPKFLDAQIDLSLPLDRLIRGSRTKNDQRSACKIGYSFHELREEEVFDEYYDHMLVPTVKLRHGERAFVSSRDSQREAFRRGHLLAAYVDDIWLGAFLMVPESATAISWATVGWRDGSEELMKKLIVSALLSEAIVRSKAAGYSHLNLGNCLPFVNDGPMNFKLKWGASLTLPSIGHSDGVLHGVNGYAAVRVNLNSEGAQALLRHCPLLVRGNAGLQAIGWQSTLRSDFKHQVDAGLPWIDLAELAGSAERLPVDVEGPR